VEAEDECDDIPGDDSSLGNPLIGCRPILYIYKQYYISVWRSILYIICFYVRLYRRSGCVVKTSSDRAGKIVISKRLISVAYHIRSTLLQLLYDNRCHSRCRIRILRTILIINKTLQLLRQSNIIYYGIRSQYIIILYCCAPMNSLYGWCNNITMIIIIMYSVNGERMLREKSFIVHGDRG